MEKDSLNSEDMNSLVSALSPDEFNRMCNCSTTKDISNTLEVTHDGANQVEESKYLLTHQYGLFKMENDESIKDKFLIK